MEESPYTSDEAVIEILASIEHQRWADWQQYVHLSGLKGEDGSLIIPADYVERWRRQIETPYCDLTEREKQSDRDQVYRYWGHIQAMLEARNTGPQE